MSSSLNDCGCCEGIAAETPANITNRPGLTAIAYRVGTHNQFKESMLAALSNSNRPQLSALTTRSDDDFSIALLDAFATMADVLTFYQERIANESYLRTATERLSVLELARLIGYELRPSVAASTYLAFTMDGSINHSTIDIAVKVQSIPGPNEKPQTFETVEKIEARPEWNAIKPRLVQPQTIVPSWMGGMSSVVVQGTATNISPGDTILITIPSIEWGIEFLDRTLKTVINVSTDNKAKTTRIDFKTQPPPPPTYVRPSLPEGSPTDFSTKVELDADIIDAIISKSWNEDDLSSLSEKQKWNLEEVAAGINEETATLAIASNKGSVFALRRHAAVFGYNAPIYESLPKNAATGYPTSPSWDVPPRTLEEDSEAMANQRFVYLDSIYPAVTKGSWIALICSSLSNILQVQNNLETTRSDYAISGKISRLTVEANSPFNDAFTIRNTSVLVQSEELALAELPIVDIVQGDTITLDGAYLGLKTGQRIILSGERDDLPSVMGNEMRRLSGVILEAGFTVLTFDKPLTHSYIRNTVTINANVALATHGETVREVLGSGDASQPYQRFALKQTPLTYTSAATPTGAESTIMLHVNDLVWHEQSTLYGHGPHEHVFITRIDDNQKVRIQSGDGVTGARLPSGQNNVQATYRKGTGLLGQVRAGQLSVLLTRPLGVKGVINPEDASGAADPESVDGARANAPMTVLTLDRAVSLEDYEDFARAFAGIAKALATWAWDGQTHGVFLTVSGPNGATIETDSDTYNNLLEALRKAGDPFVDLLVKSYRPAYFKLAGNFKVDPDFVPEKVQAAVQLALRTQFSFDARAFGQPVVMSEVIAVIQAVQGVLAVDLSQLYLSGKLPSLNQRLLAEMPVLTDGDPAAAELLTLDPAPLDELVMIQ